MPQSALGSCPPGPIRSCCWFAVAVRFACVWVPFPFCLMASQQAFQLVCQERHHPLALTPLELVHLCRLRVNDLWWFAIFHVC